MQTKIVIRRISNVKPALDSKNFTGPVNEASLDQFTILEHGMKSGESSVSFFGTMKDGSHVVIQTSASIFKTMSDALEGAEQRFKETLPWEEDESNKN